MLAIREVVSQPGVPAATFRTGRITVLAVMFASATVTVPPTRVADAMRIPEMVVPLVLLTLSFPSVSTSDRSDIELASLVPAFHSWEVDDEILEPTRTTLLAAGETSPLPKIQIVGNPGDPFTGWYNLNRIAGKPALMALNGGAAAAAIDGKSLDQQTTLATGMLAGIYPGRFRPPVAAQASGWWADEFSRGSYSFTATGSGGDDREALAEPVEGRLWLAGEAAHEKFHSTVHGAWLSGEAAAKQATA